MKKILYVTIVLMILMSATASAQSNLAIGQWQSHLSYSQTVMVTQSADQVFYATEESIMILDKEELSVDFLTRIEGLSETGIQQILFDEANQQLIVAYRNSTVDIIRSDEIISIRDISDRSDIQGDKLIYDMYIRDGQKLYMATGFGLVEYDLQALEFGFTMNIAQRISKVDGSGNILVIALDNPDGDQVGSYALDLTTTNTPGFFPIWDRLEPEQGLPQNYTAKDVLMLDDKIYVCLEEEVYVDDGNRNFELIYENTFSDYELLFIEPSPEGTMIGSYERGGRNGLGALLFLNENDDLINEVTFCIRNLMDAVIDDEGRIYFSDLWKDISYLESRNGPCVPIEVDSPYDSELRDIDVVDGRVYVASGGIRDNFGDEFGRNGAYILQEDSWTNLHGNTSQFIEDNEFIQLFQVAASPAGDKAYFGSFWAGVAQYDVATQTFDTLYNETNSTLQFLQGDSRVRISGLAFDNDNTLWVSNFGATEPLSALSAEGEWFSFRLDRSDALFVTDLEVDNQGIVWVAVGGTPGGLLIYDKGADLAESSDDRQRFLNQGNSEIPSNSVNVVRVDRSGSVWVGTGAGAVVFECGGSAAEDEGCVGNRRRVQVDGITAFLLESEDVLSIAIDGADRKWFGTRNGIFVQTPDGEEEVMRFDTRNSPLFDNTIRSMDFDPVSGLMYIGTDQGLQSIRTETTGSRDVHESDVFAFPNPVRADHTGPIAIRGLATDAEVRITDIDGHLVFKTRALGGQAIWDGRDFHGSEVASGVYLVFSNSTDQLRDIDSHVTKILVVR